MRTVKRRRSVPSGVVVAAVSLAAGVALAHASALVWVSLIPATAAAAYMLGRFSGQEAARKPPTEFAKRKRAAERQPATGRGWTAPARPGLRSMMISEYCSDGACALCPGNGCEHDCRHDPAEIVARNQREYDRTHS